MYKLIGKWNQKEKSCVVKMLIDASLPNGIFFLFLFFGIFLMTIGILVKDILFLIGGIFVTPFLLPFFSFSLGGVLSDFWIMARAFRTLLICIFFSVVLSFLISLFFSFLSLDSLPHNTYIQEHLPLLYFIASLILGLLSSLSLFVSKKGFQGVPGFFMTFLLLGPLISVGIGVSHLDWLYVLSSFSIFLLNTFGIIFSSAIVFLFVDFSSEDKQKVKNEKFFFNKVKELDPQQT
ncbi:MAG: DUF389 domain-containing protein [Candidatus Moranbacteria bacterium]|nr:DUF389 domain-containing protein [Candidatus Moranbacteria bacterium]